MRDRQTPVRPSQPRRRFPGRLDLIVPTGLAVALAALTAAVVTGGPVVGLDRLVARTAPAWPAQRTGAMSTVAAVMDAVITVANPVASVAATAVLAAALSLRERSWRALKVTVPALLALTVTVVAGKWLIGRPGPAGSPVNTLGYFPSGHTATAMVCAGTVAMLLVRCHPGRRTVLAVAAAAWTLLVGAGMLWHRYHWLSDVLASLLLGALLLWLLHRWPRLPVTPTRWCPAACSSRRAPPG
jgi:membrane-associated phospholipid phosphatase